MDKVPTLWPSTSTPPDEWDPIKDLGANLSGVAYNVEAFKAALALYEFAKSRPANLDRSTVSNWRFIACHECVLQVYHLKERLKTIKSHKIRECRTLIAHIDHGAIKRATSRLDDAFPDIDKLRDAIAHEGSVSTNPKHREPDGFGLTGFREPDVFSATYNGVVKRLPITRDSLAILQSVSDEFCQAFSEAADMLERLGHAE